LWNANPFPTIAAVAPATIASTVAATRVRDSPGIVRGELACAQSKAGRRKVSIGIDLRFQLSDLLLRGRNGTGTGNKTARRRLLDRNREKRACQLGGISGLPAILGFPVLDQRPSALVVSSMDA
jgi:hypothetical protein